MSKEDQSEDVGPQRKKLSFKEQSEYHACQEAEISQNWLFPGEHFFLLLKSTQMSRQAMCKLVGNHRHSDTRSRHGRMRK